MRSIIRTPDYCTIDSAFRYWSAPSHVAGRTFSRAFPDPRSVRSALLLLVYCFLRLRCVTLPAFLASAGPLASLFPLASAPPQQVPACSPGASLLAPPNQPRPLPHPLPKATRKLGTLFFFFCEASGGHFPSCSGGTNDGCILF